MQAILIKLFKPFLPYIAVAFAGCISFLYVVHLHRALNAANVANAALVQTNQENTAAIAAYQAQSLKWNAALDALDARTLNDNQATARIVMSIEAQPVTADAPVAPVLARALADIKNLQGAAK